MPRSALTTRLLTFALVLVAGAVAVFLAGRAGGPGAAVLAAVAVGCALGLVAYGEPAEVDTPWAEWVFDGALLVLPAALTVYLAFNSGGYFAETPAAAVIVLVLLLVLRLTLVEDPFAGFSRPLALAAGTLSLYALWGLLSATWSDAPARALIDFDRTLLYLLVLVLFGSIPRTSERLAWMARGLALGIVGVAAFALATRLFADSFTEIENLGKEQLSYPLTYSNALGILCVFGIILCLHLTSSLREPRAIRTLAAGALPLLAVTLYLTLSRGPVFALAGGLVAYLVLARARGLITGLIASVPAAVIAVAIAYRNDLLTGDDPTTRAALEQGEHVAAILGLCVLGAATLRLALTPIDSRLRDLDSLSRVARRVVAGAGVALVAAALVVALAAGGPGWISERYDSFVDSAQPEAGGDIRKSVFETANRGLIDNWDVALQAFRDEKLHGQGGGSYETFWTRERPEEQVSYELTDAHSLYLEVLAELGVVGLLLLLAVLLTILVVLAPVRRGHNRSLYAVLFALALTWLVHAGVDWDWEMPAVTVWLFAFGGAALAVHERSAGGPPPPQSARVLLGILLLAAVMAPGLIFASQTRFERSLDAFYRSDCPEAIRQAGESISALEMRPEPYDVMAACQNRGGNYRLAAQALEKAIDREPGNWRYHYNLAVARAAAGLDPRRALAAAERLGPGRSEITTLADMVRGASPSGWRRAAVPLATGAKPSVSR